MLNGFDNSREVMFVRYLLIFSFDFIAVSTSKDTRKMIASGLRQQLEDTCLLKRISTRFIGNDDVHR